MVHICLREKRPDLLGRDSKQKITMANAMSVFREVEYEFEQLCYGFYDKENKSFDYARDEIEDYIFKPKLQVMTEIIQNHEYFCGNDNITYIDFIIAEFLEILFFLCPHLKDGNIIMSYFQREFWKQDFMERYVKSGRFFRRPYNEPHAEWR